mgnify:CR=1 FL=1
MFYCANIVTFVARLNVNRILDRIWQNNVFPGQLVLNKFVQINKNIAQ